MTNKVANPGSEEAVLRGCSCPVMDNHYGRGYGGGGFVYNMTCVLHGARKQCKLGIADKHECHADRPDCEIEIVPRSDILDT
jgi:hypothetical protein